MDMTIQIDKTLFFDPQTVPEAGFCEVCGGALYAPSLVCLRCGRREMP